MSRPPPPRYKIVERDGRLVTIDTWAKGGAKQSAPSAIPVARGNATPGMAPPPGWPEPLVAAVLRVQDDEGRRLLTTGPAWDRKGPRTIAVSPTGEKRLGTVLLIGGIAMFWLVLLVIADLDWLMPVAIIGAVLFGSVSTASMPLLTRFLDSLGEDIAG